MPGEEEERAGEERSEEEEEEAGEVEGVRTTEEGGEEVIRVRIPQRRKGEIFGIVDKTLGGRRVMVRCVDGVERMARIPGRLKRREWISIGDVVIVVPWEFQNEKGDIIHKYTRPQVEWLRKKGYLK